MTKKVDVIIIGGGLSGLVSATQLADQGFSVLVIEARERVGGRTSSLILNESGIRFDEGGQWVGPNQDHILALAESLGVNTFYQRHEGTTIWDINGKILDGSKPAFNFSFITSLPALIELKLLQDRFTAWSKEIDPENPLKCPRAREWDQMNCETFIQKSVSSELNLRLMRAAIQGIHGVEPHEISVLQFLTYARQSGGVEPLVTIPNGHQERKFIGGSMTISEKLAEKLGSNVKLNSPVRKIEQNEEGVIVTTDSESFHGSYVIVAMAPAVAHKLQYEPNLPPDREHLMQRNFMGSIIKCLVLYEKNFWVEKGFSGEVAHDTSSGPVFNVYDDTRTHPETGVVQPALVGFINADAAKIWSPKTKEERKEAILKQFARWFGPEALQPTLYFEKDWLADPWSCGCPVGTFGTGSLTAPGLFEALRKPQGRIHWSGTETATVNQGFMDGAVQSGKRAAQEVLALLKQKQSD